MDSGVGMQVFAALGDPVRRRLLERIAEEGPLTASGLAEGFPLTRQGISKHLGALVAADLVSVRQEGRERHYSLNPAPLAGAVDWLAAIGAQWDVRLLRLKGIVEELSPAR